MPGWFDHQRDLVGEPHAPIRTPEYDDLTFRESVRLYGLRQTRTVRLVLAVSALLVGVLLVALPVGLLFVIIGATLFVSGLVTTPICFYLLRSVRGEIKGREYEASFTGGDGNR